MASPGNAFWRRPGTFFGVPESVPGGRHLAFPGTVFGVPGERFLTAFFQKQAQKFQKTFQNVSAGNGFRRPRGMVFDCFFPKTGTKNSKTFQNVSETSRLFSGPKSSPGARETIPVRRQKAFPGDAKKRSQVGPKAGPRQAHRQAQRQAQRQTQRQAQRLAQARPFGPS